MKMMFGLRSLFGAAPRPNASVASRRIRVFLMPKEPGPGSLGFRDDGERGEALPRLPAARPGAAPAFPRAPQAGPEFEAGVSRRSAVKGGRLLRFRAPGGESASPPPLS